MPVTIRAYIVILVLGSFALFMLARWNRIESTKRTFQLWVISWVVVTSAAFLSFNYWIYTIAIFIALAAMSPKEPATRIPFYFFLLPTLPILLGEIPGFGGVRYLFSLSYPRLLALVFLLPLFAASFRSDSPTKNGKYYPTDKFAFLFFALSFILSFRRESVTDSFRAGLYIFLDSFLPYFVFSRYIRNIDIFKNLFFAILSSTFLLAIIGMFEASKVWLLYKSLPSSLGSIVPRFGIYLERSGSLRVSTVFAGPIVFGYFLVIGYGALNFLKFYFKGLPYWVIGGTIIMALLATISRGPWVGFIAYLLVFALASPKGVKSLMFVSGGLLLGLLMLSIFPGGEKYIDLLPFLGGGGEGAKTVSYREDLYYASLDVVSQNFLFGLESFRETPEMEAMRQGQGIIDVVNSYLAIAMEKGVVGISLFAGIFLSLLWNVHKAMRLSRPLGDEYMRLGQSLLAILVAVLIIIATVSSVDYIPVYYWALAGIAAGYVNMISQTIKTQVSKDADDPHDA